MRGNELLDKMGLIDPAYVEAADRWPARKKSGGWKWVACLYLLFTASLFFWHGTGSPQDEVSADDPPHVVVGDRKFYISPHLFVTDELPEGFAQAGTADIADGYKNCPYYVNPDVPEWIYVCHEVNIDGTADETGTLINTPPHDAYVRYVDARLRGRDLICYDGRYYISLWSAETRSDVTKAYFDSFERPYKVRIEGNAPEGFVFVGTAEFSGYDTVPKGSLASNKEAARVYSNPDDLNVIFVETHWFTAPDEGEEEEKRHDGFDVYILYDCPFDEKG